MNYLAHAYLSFGNEELLVGNLVGDFVKGKKQLEKYPKSIQDGIFLHRFIDSYSDNHLILKQSIERLKPTQKRYSPVVVDIFYDYFLAKNWSLFSDQSIDEFAQATYRSLERNFSIMPEKVLYIFQKMISHNWLVGYQYEKRIEFALTKLAERVKNEHFLPFAINDLRKLETPLNEDFLHFFPDLIQAVQLKIETDYKV